MTSIQFLTEWALRSSILILSGALVLWALRVKDPSIRLAAWTVLLVGSLALPALTASLPRVSFATTRAAVQPIETAIAFDEAASTPVPASSRPFVSTPPRRFDWPLAALTLYVSVALALLLRLCVGLALSLRLLRSSLATEIGVRESDRVTAPVTLGIVRPAIVLPGDWRQWDAARLDAVLAHERSHIRRRDPALQLLSAIHRALLWHSPASWFLHQRIVRAGEEASDDAALAVTRDRAFYAEMLLDFIERGARRASWLGVSMARYGRAEKRIHRILDGTTLSRGVTRWSVAAILALGCPLAYLVAAAHPQQSPPPAPTLTEKPPAAEALPVKPAQAQPETRPAPVSRPKPVYLTALGSVAASATVVVKPRVEGQLMSVNYKEGETVQAGQLLASIDAYPYQVQLDRAEGQLAGDRAQLDLARTAKESASKIAELEAAVKTDRANADIARLQMTYTRVVSPITGVTGLHMIDPGNFVHPGEPLLIVTEIQPIAVLITVPEDELPRLRARLRDGANVPVEAWNRDSTVKLATGRLTAIDNLIDQTAGTAKLKALFANKDDALFPNQFVNVRIVLAVK